MVELGVNQETGKPDDEARWMTSMIWYGLRDLRVKPVVKVSPAIAKFWTGVECIAWVTRQA